MNSNIQTCQPTGKGRTLAVSSTTASHRNLARHSPHDAGPWVLQSGYAISCTPYQHPHALGLFLLPPIRYDPVRFHPRSMTHTHPHGLESESHHRSNLGPFLPNQPPLTFPTGSIIYSISAIPQARFHLDYSSSLCPTSLHISRPNPAPLLNAPLQPRSITPNPPPPP
ncbi:hypothetical protein EJ04DRAFT_293026 [Polyplosphaeria fusca]|uniref:Uncharacterized protein n=1 Tax=Polyplosphaeria fusca TaxID=682080 RepID=A0A9P4R7Y1_9PLEO|nr:hypothetical protein EJ04DRAFT_293026 [Polyplosphaeria fusca]